MKKYNSLLFVVFSSCISLGQVAFDERNWLIGRYYGEITRVDVTWSNTVTCPGGLDISKYTDTIHLYLQDSSCIYQYWSVTPSKSTVLVVENDSSLTYASNTYGRLKANDSLYLSYSVTSGSTVFFEYYYKMAKYKSYWSGVGISELQESKSIDLFPNPVSDKLFLQSFNNIEVNRLLLLGIDGKEIILTINKNNEIDVHEIQEGLYFLQIHTGKSILTKKIIIAR